MECYDTSIAGNVKYNKGRQTRNDCIVLMQKIIEVKETEKRRKEKLIKATIVNNWTQETLGGNICANVEHQIQIKTYGWRGYSNLA